MAHRMSAFCTCLLLVLGLGACAPLHVIPTSRQNPSREAILVLPGIGMKRSALDEIRAFGREAHKAGFDLFVLDYRSRKSVAAGVEALHRLMERHDLGRYRRVHVFAYILGGFTFNRLVERYPFPNLGHVVYDRSPLQELAPRLATTGWMRLPTRLAAGPVVADLAAIPYPAADFPGDHRVGLIIENRATPFVRRRRKRALALKSLSFDPADLGQEHDAVLHVRFNHTEMYTHFEVIGPELLHFFRHGDFTDQARRVPLGIDPFSKEP